MLSRVLPRLSLVRLARTPTTARVAHGVVYGAPTRTFMRPYATPPPQTVENNNISMEEYHKLSDKVMDGLTEQLEGLVDQCGRDDYEVEYSSGVLTLSVGEHGTYVINKQPPNKQIWLSSPHSGPKRYDYMTDGSWRYTRDNHALLDLLNEELAPAFTDFTKLAIDE